MFERIGLPGRQRYAANCGGSTRQPMGIAMRVRDPAAHRAPHRPRSAAPSEDWSSVAVVPVYWHDVRASRFAPKARHPTLKPMELSMQLAPKFDSAQDPALRTLVRIFGVVWLINAAFQAMAWLFAPAAKANFLHALAKPAATVPAGIRPLLVAAVHTAQAVGPQVIAGIMVVIAILLGISLLSGKRVALAARVGIVYCLLCWVFFNGFGFPYS
ncbi:MAG: hypothetical protein ACYCT1_20205, partial [Steroidobacteraceae bacterium]